MLWNQSLASSVIRLATLSFIGFRSHTAPIFECPLRCACDSANRRQSTSRRARERGRLDTRRNAIFASAAIHTAPLRR